MLSRVVAVVFISVLVMVLFTAPSFAMPPVDVVASVRGKKYDVSAETVEEFTQKVEGLVAGLEAGQSSVLFRGKVLSLAENLEEVGVTTGDILMVVKGRKQRSSKADFEAEDDMVTSMGDVSGAPGGGSLDEAMNSEAYKKAMANASPEEMQKAMKAMDNLLDSEFVDEYFADDERLENARQQMLTNADQYENMMPGFKEQALAIASDPVKWREAMLQAKDQITKLKAQRDAMRAGGKAPTTTPEE